MSPYSILTMLLMSMIVSFGWSNSARIIGWVQTRSLQAGRWLMGKFRRGKNAKDKPETKTEAAPPAPTTNDIGPKLDEPYFILMASRPNDSSFLRQWATEQIVIEGRTNRADEALKCAEQMDAWRRENIKEPSEADRVIISAFEQLHSVYHDPGSSFANCHETVCAERRRIVVTVSAVDVSSHA